MRKLLLATCAAVGMGVGGDAKAIDFEAAVAAALSFNYGGVAGFTGSIFTADSAVITGSVSGNIGVTQANQNVGAGSMTQNAAAIAAVEGVELNDGFAGALALSGNVGQVGGGSITLGGVTGASMTDAVRGNTGVTQVNQNAGAGSLLQNSASLAAISLCGGDCVDVGLAVTVAAAGNYGTVTSRNLEGVHAAGALMSDSVRANVGLTQVSQNAGAGSLTQNAVAVGAVLPTFSGSPFNVR